MHPSPSQNGTKHPSDILCFSNLQEIKTKIHIYDRDKVDMRPRASVGRICFSCCADLFSSALVNLKIHMHTLQIVRSRSDRCCVCVVLHRCSQEPSPSIVASRSSISTPPFQNSRIEVPFISNIFMKTRFRADLIIRGEHTSCLVHIWL